MNKQELVMCSAALAAAVLAGCSASPAKPRAAASETRAGTVFAQSTERTQRAARDALTVLGFEIKKAEPLYVEGYRPRKIGMFVGSGGETAGVWLEPMGPDQTRVLVDTAKSLVGIAGQKDWDDEILAEMRKVTAAAQ
jgi:hypothetical protein